MQKRDIMQTSLRNMQQFLKAVKMIIFGCKNDNFWMKKREFFLSFAQIINCGYTSCTLEQVPTIYV